MANIFLKVEGIPGESTDEDHQDEIDVLGWSWGVSRGESRAAAAIGRATASGGLENILGGRQPRARTSVADLIVDKRIDRASPRLLLAALQGQIIGEATLAVSDQTDSEPVQFLTITMSSVTVVSVHETGSPDEHLEQLALRFEKFTYEHVPFSPTGGAGSEFEFGWNSATNEQT